MLLHMNARHVETVTNLPHKQHVVIKQVRSARGLMRRFMRRHWGIMLEKKKKKKKKESAHTHVYADAGSGRAVGRLCTFFRKSVYLYSWALFSTKKVRLRRRALKL